MLMMSWKLSRYVFATVSRSKIDKCIFWDSIGYNKRLLHTTQSTIDRAEVDFFSKQMKDWWNPDGELALLHRYNTVRVPFIRDGLVQCTAEQRELQPLKDKQILDVGCGGGILSEALAKLGAHVTGIDASKELIEVSKAHAQINPRIAKNKPLYYCTTIEEHAKSYENYYDGVVASEVIEHVNNQEIFVQSCIQALKPGGKIFFTTPNRSRISQFVIIFLSENIFKCTPQGAHQYEKFITPNELTFILERNNCHVESTYGVQYNPITKKMCFSKYNHFLYVLQAQKLR